MDKIGVARTGLGVSVGDNQGVQDRLFDRVLLLSVVGRHGVSAFGVSS